MELRALALSTVGLLTLACGDDSDPSPGTGGAGTALGTSADDGSGDDGIDDGNDAPETDGNDAPATDGNDDGMVDSDSDGESTGEPLPPGPAGSCGMGGGKNEILQITMDSPERWYLIGAPDTDEPLPLVLAFHGDEGDPFNSTRYIWGSYWENNDLPFIVVMTKCPGCTSWYMDDTNANADYVWDVLADVATNHNVDVSRIYSVGYSGGSEFLSMHGWEFQDVFAGIQFTCGGNAYFPYQPPSRPDCKVRGRIVISADDFLWDGAQMLLARLQAEGHEHEFVEAQCNGHCCDTIDHNAGAWAWFQTVTKCGGIVPGTCGELTDLPPAAYAQPRGLTPVPTAPSSTTGPEPVFAPVDFDAARDRLDAALTELESTDGATVAAREALFREAMGAYDSMLAAAHRHGPEARAELRARYPQLRAWMAQLRQP